MSRCRVESVVLGPLPCKDCGKQVAWMRLFDKSLIVVTWAGGNRHACRWRSLATPQHTIWA